MMKSFAAAVMFFCSLSAQTLTPSEALEKIRASYSTMTDVSALFTQHVQMKFKRGSQTVSGSVKIKKGNKYRLETEQQTIVSNGVTVWMFTPRTKQVIIDAVKQHRAQFSPDKFLLGLPKEFTAGSIEKDSLDIILTLLPTSTSSMASVMKQMRVWADPQSWIFRTVEVTDKNSTVTTYALSDIRFNKGISDSIFIFDVTEDMKVVDMKTLK